VATAKQKEAARRNIAKALQAQRSSRTPSRSDPVAWHRVGTLVATVRGATVTGSHARASASEEGLN